MDTLYIVMPAYNEEANIEAVIADWYPVLQGKSEFSRLVVADSGSTDSTHSLLLTLMGQYPLLRVISNTQKQHGPKVIALYRYAIEKGADYIFQTDSDGQTSPEEFDSFWQDRASYDAILGNRCRRGDGVSRAIVERIVCLMLRLYFGVIVPDANAPFRLMKAEALVRYLPRFPEDYFLPNIMLTTYFAYYQHPITFREISFRPRQGGKNSIHLAKIFSIGWQAQKDFRRFKREMNE